MPEGGLEADGLLQLGGAVDAVGEAGEVDDQDARQLQQLHHLGRAQRAPPVLRPVVCPQGFGFWDSRVRVLCIR